MIIKDYKGKLPIIHPTAWVAENAVIIGDVEIGPRVSVWYNVVIRGDTNYIRIGEDTNIQDGSILHVETLDGPCIIGKRVTIGHGAIVHGCTVEDDVLIGIGAKVLSYSKIGPGALVAAAALIREGQVVSPQTIVAGVPAKEKGPVSPEMAARMKLSGEHYLELMSDYQKESTQSSSFEIENKMPKK